MWGKARDIKKECKYMIGTVSPRAPEVSSLPQQHEQVWVLLDFLCPRPSVARATHLSNVPNLACHDFALPVDK